MNVNASENQGFQQMRRVSIGRGALARNLFKPALVGGVFLLFQAAAPEAWANDVIAGEPNGPAASASTSTEEIIVTGTRESGRQLKDSDTPITSISSETLTQTGATTLFDALKSVVPSLNTLGVAGDVTALLRSFSIDGLSPGDVLVLINGKRRHLSALINQSTSPYIGSNPVDISLIPLSEVDHVEVLRAGATSGYGTDAIAGVVNIILKRDASGVDVAATGGATAKGDGATAQFGSNAGFKLGENGFANVSFDYDHHDNTNRSNYDPRSDYTVRNKITGDARFNVEAVGLNLETPINEDFTAYSFATFAHRTTSAYQTRRTPTQLGALVEAIYPSGFIPVLGLAEYDGAITAGIKGDHLLGWNWDLSTTYGRDSADIGISTSVNPNLLASTGNAQTSFNDGSFGASQLDTTFDLRRPFDTGLWSAPLNVAWGIEHRYETYHLGAGEPASYLLGGSTAYPGFTPTSSSSSSRNVVGGYGDLSTYFTPEWQAHLAGRVENYEDVGTGITGQASTRYDFSAALGIRGNVGNGYHAPTLAQDNFATTNVSPTSASAQLPVTSPGAKILGAPALTSEKSFNFGFGLISNPIPGVHASVDAYSIRIDNRIIDTASFFGPLSLAAIEANGNVLPAGVATSAFSAKFFTNGVNTSTRGVDLHADYDAKLGSGGVANLFTDANYNDTRILSVNAAPGALGEAGVSLVNPAVVSSLTSQSPKIKVAVGGKWLPNERWEVTLRDTLYGATEGYIDPVGNGKHFYNSKVNRAFITDLTVKYNVTQHGSIQIGAENLFNKEPTETYPSAQRNDGEYKYPVFSPFGIDGGYYFARLNYKW